MAKKGSPPLSDRPDSPISPDSSTDDGGGDRLLSDSEHEQNLFDEEPDCDQKLSIPQTNNPTLSEMVKKSASNLTDELDNLVRQAYMDGASVHELADEVKEDHVDSGFKYKRLEKHPSLELSELQGIVMRDGEMVSFVAEDLAEKIRLSSPASRKSETPTSVPGSRSSTPSLYRQTLNPQIPIIDPAIINDLESHAYKVASTVDTMLENLTGTLHSMSSLTVDCMDIYKDSVCKTCDVVDSNIKSMYQLMAKCEELNKSMSSVYILAHQTYPLCVCDFLPLKFENDIDNVMRCKEIKRILELFESLVEGSK
ncbi:BLOC-1-related complex subunit 6 [Nymphon striatum]|nr:BLOC-1-related complex subunit 6 [Nymphon striatum]